jgi:hypothetical protein
MVLQWSILPPTGPGSGNTLSPPAPAQGLTVVHVKLCHKFLVVCFVIPGSYLLHQKRVEKLFCFPCFEKEQKVAKVEELYFALNMP